jgi:tRNA dimethylallyltransferase
MGPTAAGKTDAAVALAERLPVSLVSVDSAMVYRGLDIGTGKPDACTQARAPHRLIDIRDPAQPYSAADFRRDALAAIMEIQARGRVPVLVGGTGLYFRALRQGLAPLPPADPAVRADLEAQAYRLGWPALHRRLAERDPEAARRIRPSDAQRVQRALEVIAVTGRPMSELLRRNTGDACPFPVIPLSLEPVSRTWLHGRIERRFLAMLDAGLEAEVAALAMRGDLSAELPALRAVGYRQMLEYLRGDVRREVMIARSVAATRQLARRQLTWLRSDRLRQRLAADGADPVRQVLAAVAGALAR